MISRMPFLLKQKIIAHALNTNSKCLYHYSDHYFLSVELFEFYFPQFPVFVDALLRHALTFFVLFLLLVFVVFNFK